MSDPIPGAIAQLLGAIAVAVTILAAAWAKRITDETDRGGKRKGKHVDADQEDADA